MGNKSSLQLHTTMGPKDLERIEDNRAERLEEKENKSNRRFEELKNEKIAEKFGKKEQFTDEAMLEWIELNKQLRIDQDTGKPYADKVTASDKSKSMILDVVSYWCSRWHCFSDARRSNYSS